IRQPFGIEQASVPLEEGTRLPVVACVAQQAQVQRVEILLKSLEALGSGMLARGVEIGQGLGGPILVPQVLGAAAVGGHVEVEPGLGVPNLPDDLAQVLAGIAEIAPLPVGLTHRNVADRADSAIPRHVAALDACRARVFLQRAPGPSARQLDHAEMEMDEEDAVAGAAVLEIVQRLAPIADCILEVPGLHVDQDRKSTRLNSSHVKISYAV